jgi:single-strand DNA-binding protein
MNRVILMGNLTQKPLLKQTEKTRFAKCVIAVDKGKDITNFFKIVAFKNQADYMATYADKGSRVVLEGVLSSYKWTDDKGGSQYGVEILVDRVWVIDRKNHQPEIIKTDGEIAWPVEPTKQKEFDLNFEAADDDLPF